MNWKVTLLSVIDSQFQGEQEDTSVQVIRELVEEELFGEIVDYRIVPSDQNEIRAALTEMIEYFRADLILTTGGTGLDAHDVTPEATLKVADRTVPGLSEAMRAAAVARSRSHALSRGVCAIRGRTLIVNLPGDPKGVYDHLLPIIDILPEALRQVSGRAKES